MRAIWGGVGNAGEGADRNGGAWGRRLYSSEQAKHPIFLTPKKETWSCNHAASNRLLPVLSARRDTVRNLAQKPPRARPRRDDGHSGDADDGGEERRSWSAYALPPRRHLSVCASSSFPRPAPQRPSSHALLPHVASYMRMRNPRRRPPLVVPTSTARDVNSCARPQPMPIAFLRRRRLRRPPQRTSNGNSGMFWAYRHLTPEHRVWKRDI